MAGPGSTVPYIDYSAAPELFPIEDTIYGKAADGYNLVQNCLCSFNFCMNFFFIFNSNIISVKFNNHVTLR